MHMYAYINQTLSILYSQTFENLLKQLMKRSNLPETIIPQCQL